MNRKILTFGVAGIAAAAALVAPELALAQDAASAGQNILDNFTAGATGNIGLLIGLGIAALGLWKWLMDQSSWGIILIIGGVLVTAFPGIFKSVSDFAGQATGLNTNENVPGAN